MQREGSSDDGAGSDRIAEDDNLEIIPGSEASTHVMLGRGARSIGNQGNVVFRNIVQTRKTEYCATNNRKTKDVIARQVMTAVYQRNAKFVRKRSPDADDDDSWLVVTDEETILRKIKQSLRDRDPGEGRTSRREQVARPLRRDPPAVASRPTSRSGESSPSNADRRPPKKRRQLHPEGGIISASSSTHDDSRHSSADVSGAFATAGSRQPFPGNDPHLSAESLLQRMARQQRSAGSMTTNNFPAAAAASVPSDIWGALRMQQQEQTTVGPLFVNQRPGQQHHVALSPPSNRFGHSINQLFPPSAASLLLGQQHQPSLPGDSILNQQQQNLLAAGWQPDCNVSTLRRLNTSTSLNATPASASLGSHHGLSSDGVLLAVHHRASRNQLFPPSGASLLRGQQHQPSLHGDSILNQQQQNLLAAGRQPDCNVSTLRRLNTSTSLNATPASASSGSHHGLSSDGDLLAVHHRASREQRHFNNSWQLPEEREQPASDELLFQQQQQRRRTEHSLQEEKQQDLSADDLLTLEILQRRRRLEAFLSQQNQGAAFGGGHPMLSSQSSDSGTPVSDLLALQLFQQRQQLQGLLSGQQQQQQNFRHQLQLLSAEQQQARGPESAAVAVASSAVAPRGTSTDSSPEDKKPKAREH